MAVTVMDSEHESSIDKIFENDFIAKRGQR